MSKKLLPSGFHDILFPEAAQLQDLCTLLSHYYAGFGYQEVSPPLLEFEENLASEDTLQFSEQMFRTLDPVSNKMLALRSDFTAQIARISTTRLDHDALPLRINYSGQVFRVQSETIHPHRQLTHSGVEIIGADGIEAEYEILYMMLNTLETLGYEALCLDFSLPSVIRNWLERSSLSTDEKHAVEHALEKRDIETIKQCDAEFAASIAPLFNAEISTDTLASTALFNDECLPLVKTLAGLIERITTEFPTVQISIDPLEISKFSYHSGISYSLFSRTHNLELGRGGRYRIPQPKQALEAVGFTCYVDELLRASTQELLEQRVLVAPETPYTETDKLREESYITLHHLSTDSDELEKAAKTQRCAYIYRNGELHTL